MKLWYKFLFLSVFVLAFTGCGKDEVEDEEQDEVETTDGVPYHSLDMKTDDGKVTQLQKHKIGKGVPIVIMGDGFVDKDIKVGKYRDATNKALEALFSVHPMKSLRDYFDVYEVTAVSYNDFSGFMAIAEDSPTFNTAFSVEIVTIAHETAPGAVGYSFEIKPGDNKKTIEYAKKAIDGNRIEDATIIMLVNADYARAICSHVTFNLSSSNNVEIPTGCSVAFVPLEDIKQSNDYDISQTGFARTLLHEFGHAFGKLADEYADEGNVWITDPDIDLIQTYQHSGFSRNISLSSDVTKSYWADFAADSRYEFESLGCYEGAEHYSKGVYRATKENMMCCNGDFNVVHRSMFYKRCMRIAFGDSWKYDYEDFVKFDLEKAKAEHEELRNIYPQYAKSKRFGAPPIIVNKIAK